jgi:hypothetical protein
VPEPSFESILPILLGRASYAVALMGRMGVPTERPVLENLIATRGAENAVTDHVIDRQIVGVDDDTVRIALNRHGALLG